MKNKNSDSHDLGLRQDAPRLIESAIGRRQVLSWLAAGGTTALLGAGPRPAEAAAGIGDVQECVLPSSETPGPFPADGSNSRGGSVINVLDTAGVVRKDIRKSIGKASGTAGGLPLRLTMRLLDVDNACRPLEGHAVYLWHCTADGRYSLYDQGVTNENFLRGVQAADANGEVSFTTVFPGCYRGRYPHMHFEVFPSLDATSGYRNRVLTSQIAMPAEACAAAYGSDGYAGSRPAWERTSIKTDGVFRNSTPQQLAVMTASMEGSAESGFDGALTIGVAGV